jgi:RNA polymerase sigma factor (TIGR02999 family)
MLPETGVSGMLLWGRMADSAIITRILNDWSSGNQSALDALTPYVYDELHVLARAYLRRRRPNQTLQPTALINEVYLRLIDKAQPVHFENRAHFLGIAAHLMRQVLVDYSRSHFAAKRGSGAAPVSLDMAAGLWRATPDVLELDEALNRLADFDPRRAAIVEMQYFGGMTREEIAFALDVSFATVKRDLRLAVAWLRSYLQGGQ